MEAILTYFFTAVLEEFLNYVVKLEFDDEPDYNKCRKMFQNGLTKAKYPLDGKIDFTTPKKAAAAKKVRNSSPVKRPARNSSPVKRPAAGKKAVVESSSSSSDSDENEEPIVKKSVAKRAKVAMKDQGCQTSPAFVKAARAAKAKLRARNPEMDDFAKMAIKSAKTATKKGSGGAAAAAEMEDTENLALSNPTPAMMALMAKKAETDSAKKRKRK